MKKRYGQLTMENTELKLLMESAPRVSFNRLVCTMNLREVIIYKLMGSLLMSNMIPVFCGTQSGKQ